MDVLERDAGLMIGSDIQLLVSSCAPRFSQSTTNGLKSYSAKVRDRRGTKNCYAEWSTMENGKVEQLPIKP